MINVTLIDSAGSPTSFQCFDGFPEFLRRTEDAILRTGRRPIVRVFTFDTAKEVLEETMPEEVLRMARQAREMFAPVPKRDGEQRH